MTPWPALEVTLAANAGPDLRNYRVDFAKLYSTFPSLEMAWTVQDGVAELARAYMDNHLTYDDFTSSRYVRLRRIKDLLSAGLVDDMLRRQVSTQFPPPPVPVAQETH